MSHATLSVADILAKVLSTRLADPSSPNAANQAELPADLAALVSELAKAIGVAPEEVLRRSLGLAARVEGARALGGHLGLVADPGKLDAEVTAGGDLVADLVRRLKPDEHDDERRSRLRAEERAALLEDVKALVLFGVLLVVTIALGGLCVALILRADTSPETQRWAQTILAALLSGSVSFLVGRKVGAR